MKLIYDTCPVNPDEIDIYGEYPSGVLRLIRCDNRGINYEVEFTEQHDKGGRD